MNAQAAIERASQDGFIARRAERDRDLLDALRSREPMAAERLVDRYGERAYRLARRITGSGPDADEVVQDAFWAVIRKIDSFRGESAFGSWLYRIVANAAYQKTRSRNSRRHEVSLDEVLPLFDGSGHHAAPVDDWSPYVEDPALQAEMRMALGAAIDALPAPYRTVLILRDIDGRSCAEIADALGLNVCAVKTRVHRARLFLRKRLGDCATTSAAGLARAVAS